MTDDISKTLTRDIDSSEADRKNLLQTMPDGTLQFVDQSKRIAELEAREATLREALELVLNSLPDTLGEVELGGGDSIWLNERDCRDINKAREALEKVK